MSDYYIDIAKLPRKILAPILGIDYSRRNVGIAISDSQLQYAMPLKVLSIKDYNRRMKQILDLCDAYRITFLVLGMPWRENNLRNAQMDIILNFIRDFKKKYNGDIFLQDESMTTVQANSIAYNLDIHGERNDHFAASVILQRFLNKYNHYLI